jgi:mannan endo-1,4-beta-mannosidase
MRRSVLAAVALPAGAAIVVCGVLLARRPSSLLHPSTVLHSASPPSSAHAGSGPAPATCADRSVPMPFTGVAINPPITETARSFSDATRTRMDVIEFYSGFPRPFPSHEARQAAGGGALPLIQLNPRNVSLASIAGGHYDTYLRTYADAVRAFGCHVVLSFGHEMNGSWYSWGRPGTSPATFIAAWRHIYRFFKAQHVHNVTWSWDPDHVWQPSHGGSWASEWWPGAAYVDWVGIDGYQRPGETFNSIFAKQLANIRSFTKKPLYIAETGVEPSTDQPSQISGLFAAVRQYHLAGLIWFDIDRKEKWKLEGDSRGLAAFHKAAAELAR